MSGEDRDEIEIKQCMKILHTFPRKRDVLDAFTQLKQYSKGNGNVLLDMCWPSTRQKQRVHWKQRWLSHFASFTVAPRYWSAKRGHTFTSLYISQWYVFTNASLFGVLLICNRGFTTKHLQGQRHPYPDWLAHENWWLFSQFGCHCNFVELVCQWYAWSQSQLQAQRDSPKSVTLHLCNPSDQGPSAILK